MTLYPPDPATLAQWELEAERPERPGDATLWRRRALTLARELERAARDRDHHAHELHEAEERHAEELEAIESRYDGNLEYARERIAALEDIAERLETRLARFEGEGDDQ